MKRLMTPSELAKAAYFLLSLLAVVLFCENIPLCIAAVANLAVAARVLRTIPIDDIIDD